MNANTLGFQFWLGLMVGVGGTGTISLLAALIIGGIRDARTDRHDTDAEVARIREGLVALAAAPARVVDVMPATPPMYAGHPMPTAISLLAARGALPKRGVPPPIRLHAYVDHTMARDLAYPQYEPEPLPKRVPGFALGELPEDAPKPIEMWLGHVDAALAVAYGLPDASRRGRWIERAADWLISHLTLLAGLGVAVGWSLRRPAVARHTSDEERPDDYEPAEPGRHRRDETEPLDGEEYVHYNEVAQRKLNPSWRIPTGEWHLAMAKLFDQETAGAAR